MTSHDCDKVIDRVSDFLNLHDITAADESAIQRHLKDCPPAATNTRLNGN